MQNLDKNIDFRLFQELMKDNDYRRYFFKNLKDIKWFEILKRYNYFDYNEDQSFSYILGYIQRVIEIIKKEKPDEKDVFYPEIINIVKSNLKKYDVPLDYFSIIDFWQIILAIDLKYYDIELIGLLKTSKYEDKGYSQYRAKLLKKLLNDSNDNITYIQLLLDELITLELDNNISYKEFKHNLSHKEVEILNNNRQLIATKIVSDYSFLIKKIKDAIDKHGYLVSFIYRSSIEDSKQNTKHLLYEKTEHIIISLIRDCMLLDENRIGLIERFLSSEFYNLNYSIFPRLAIFIIDQFWNKDTSLQKEFWKFLNYLITEQNKPEVDYSYYYYFHELFNIFKNHCNEMVSSGTKDIIDHFICSLDNLNTRKDWEERYSKEDYNREAYIKYEKNRFLNAFIECNAYKHLNIQVEKHPDYHIFMSGGIVIDKSPIPKEEFNSKSIEERINYIREKSLDLANNKLIENRNEDNIERFSLKGLGSLLTESIKEDIIPYLPYLNDLIDLDKTIISDIIYSFRDITKDKQRNKEINWSLIIKFVEKILNKNLYDHCIFLYTGWFLKDIIQNFEDIKEKPDLIKSIYNLITCHLKNLSIETLNNDKDFSFDALNTPKGVFSEIFLLLMINFDIKETNTLNTLKEELNKEKNYLIFNRLGFYFDYLYYYIDRNKEKDFFINIIIKKILNFDDASLKSFLQGYFYEFYYIPEIYQLFKDSLYKRIIEGNFFDDQEHYRNQRFTGFIVHLWLFENDKYLLEFIIKENKTQELDRLIKYLNWMGIRDEYKGNKEIENKIVKFWTTLELFNKPNNILDNYELSIISESLNILFFINEDNVKTPYIKEFFNKVINKQSDVQQFHLHKPLEQLVRILEFDFKFVYELNIEIMKKGYVHYLVDDDLNIIKSIHSKDPEMGLELAKKYIEKDPTFFSEILEWYRQNSKLH